MITGEIKNRIDSIWDTFWTGGITNSITILEQMTYLFFMKMLDDAQRTREEQSFLVPVDEIHANDYGLSINKCKEVGKVKVEYEAPAVVLGRIEQPQAEITAAFAEFKKKYL